MQRKRKRTPEEKLMSHAASYARRIREIRKENKYTQTQIAELLFVAQKTYSDYELGITRIPVDLLLVLAEYYDIDMNYICGLTEEKGSFPKKKKGD